MQNLDNQPYAGLLRDLIHDAFYSNISNRGKIMLMRAYAEVIVRQILLIPVGEEMTLGKKFVREKITIINNPLLTTAVSNIREKGNASTHTQDISDKKETEVESVLDSLFDLLAYLFIRFFEEHPFGSNPEIMTQFSLQPPIIRYKTLIYLYNQNSSNVDIIDKLVLSTLKTKGNECALDWVNQQALHLKALPSVTKEGEKNILLQLGDVLGRQIINSAPNMYDLCLEKISKLSNTPNRVMYDDFESALPYYKEHGTLSGTTREEIEFNSIMEFLYLGRKESAEITSE